VRGMARWLPRALRTGGCSGQALPAPGRPGADAP
jgi:hypothetical protein